MLRMHMVLVAGVLAGGAVCAAEPRPEIARGPYPPQALGVRHTVRTLPEACVRIDGQYANDPRAPYVITMVRTRERCQPRAGVLDTVAAKPSAAAGWILNDVIRVPSAACPGQRAVLRVWRKDFQAAPPQRDAQGRARIYLKESLDAARAGKLRTVPAFTVELTMEGQRCD